MLRRHRLIEAYLVAFLGYTWDTVHRRGGAPGACRLRHAGRADGGRARQPRGGPAWRSDPHLRGRHPGARLHAAVRGRRPATPPRSARSQRGSPTGSGISPPSGLMPGARSPSWTASLFRGRSRSRSTGTRTSSVTSWRRSCSAPRRSRHERHSTPPLDVLDRLALPAHPAEPARVEPHRSRVPRSGRSGARRSPSRGRATWWPWATWIRATGPPTSRAAPGSATRC